MGIIEAVLVGQCAPACIRDGEVKCGEGEKRFYCR